MVAATHCFDRDLMMTLVRDNVDPIARAERSDLIMAMTLFGTNNAAELVQPTALPRVARRCPELVDATEEQLE